MLQVRGLNSLYGRAHILFDVALDVAAGEVVVLIGRNGAGKSTTLKSIIGLVRPASGSIVFRGEQIQRLPVHAIARRGIGYVPEDRRILTGLTVLENLEVGRQPPRDGVPAWTVEKLLEMFPALGDRLHQRGGQLSGGEQQMLTIARTLMGNPSLILLDEPSEGLAPVVVDQLCRTIISLKRHGLAILLSEQNLRFAEPLCERACVIAKGRIRFAGPMAELAENASARAAYLSV